MRIQSAGKPWKTLALAQTEANRLNALGYKNISIMAATNHLVGEKLWYVSYEETINGHQPDQGPQ
jgi:hypothetical protein